MTRPQNPLRRDPLAMPQASAPGGSSKQAAARRFVEAVSARLGLSGANSAGQVLAAFDERRTPSLAARAGWAEAAAPAHRAAAPDQAAVNAVAAKAGWKA